MTQQSMTFTRPTSLLSIYHPDLLQKSFCLDGFIEDQHSLTQETLISCLCQSQLSFGGSIILGSVNSFLRILYRTSPTLAPDLNTPQNPPGEAKMFCVSRY